MKKIEQDVLRELESGKNIAEVAEKLGITKNMAYYRAAKLGWKLPAPKRSSSCWKK